MTLKHQQNLDGERTLAVFIDFENIGIGLINRRERFDISLVLERLVEKGKIVVKKAYADWGRFPTYTAPLHESAIELIEIPRRSQTGKNSADIRLCVDAMDLSFSRDHIDTFVIVSGDSDFSPLVSKLKEFGKHVIGLGIAEATSDLLRDNCDEFIYYDDLDRSVTKLTPLNPQIPENKRKMFHLFMESLLALRRENKEVLWSSMIKDTMKRKKPSFNEQYYEYRTFSELLEDAQKLGLVELEKHNTSGTYVVTRFGSELLKPNGTHTANGNGNPIGTPLGTGTSEPVRTSRRRRRPSRPKADGTVKPELTAGTVPVTETAEAVINPAVKTTEETTNVPMDFSTTLPLEILLDPEIVQSIEERHERSEESQNLDDSEISLPDHFDSRSIHEPKMVKPIPHENEGFGAGIDL